MSTIQHFGKGTLRVVKNYTKGYSDVQAKVRDATSNDPWGPSGTQMNELAQMTYNQSDFVEIMEMLDKRLNDKGKNWRHVFKALTVLDYCLHAGSENVVIYFKDNIYIVKTLKEFQYIDEFQKDQGANVRQKAKDITNLLQDDARLREQRKSRAHMRERMTGSEQDGDYDRDPGNENPARRSQDSPPPRARRNQGDDELQRALAESKRSAEQERYKNALTAEERDLQAALKLSQEEEAARTRAIEDANSRSLFDEQNQQNSFTLIDPSVQPQFTAVQPQFTAFNPYAQQLQQQQQQQQDEYLRQQAQWQQLQLQQQQQQEQFQQQAQQEEWARQQAAQLQLQQLQQEEWARQQQQQQQAMFQQQQQPQQLQPQPTGFGANNPFALNQRPQPSPSPVPPLPTSYPSFESSATPPRRPSPTQANTLANARRAQDDGKNAHLAQLFANRDDGVDSFGNTGSLRYGHAYGGNLISQPTGQQGSSNPFAAYGQQQQQNHQQNEQPFFSI